MPIVGRRLQHDVAALRLCASPKGLERLVELQSVLCTSAQGDLASSMCRVFPTRERQSVLCTDLLDEFSRVTDFRPSERIAAASRQHPEPVIVKSWLVVNRFRFPTASRNRSSALSRQPRRCRASPLYPVRRSLVALQAFRYIVHFAVSNKARTGVHRAVVTDESPPDFGRKTGAARPDASKSTKANRRNSVIKSSLAI